MTSLAFYGGAGEIGGTKILLNDKDTKVFLDFGESFDRGDEYAYDYLKLQNAYGLSGLFEFDLMPRIPRIFSEEALRLTDMKYEKPDIDGIMISHSHSDHISDITYVDPDIPIHIGHGTLEIANIYHDMYPQLFSIGTHNDFRTFKSGDRVRIKDISFEPVHVEHSVPGAYGFIIDSSKGPIVYSGDLRMHGPRSDLTREFIDKARKSKPHALLMEGTNMAKGSDHSFTEEEVKMEVERIMSNAKGTVFTYFPSTNVDRFMTLYNAAVKNKRMLVVDTNLAYYIKNIRSKLPIIPDLMADASIGVYFPPKKSCTFCEGDYYYKDDKLLLPKMVNYRDIQAKPEKYVMHMSFNKLAELVHIKPKNADFIYSSSEHFYEGEDNEQQRKVWESWMEHFGIAFHKAHCSGHASKEDIAKMIELIDPEILIPVHTNLPEEFKKLHGNVMLPEKEGTTTL
jgi:ribonuclease J